MVGEGVVFQGMRGYTVAPHAPAVACLTMSLTQHIWLKKKYYRVPTFNPVGSEATRLSVLCVSFVVVCCLVLGGGRGKGGGGAEVVKIDWLKGSGDLRPGRGWGLMHQPKLLCPC